MAKLKLVFILVAVMFVLALPTPALALPDDTGFTREVEDGLVCLCNCGKQLISECECSDAEAIRVQVRQMVSSGMSKKNILDYFENRYGLEILAAPPAKGFNLTAWVIPGVLIVVSGLGMGLFIRRRVKAARQSGATLPTHVTVDEDTENLLDEELKKYL